MKPISISKILALNAYWFGLSFMWNGLHVLILPAVLLHLVPEAQKNTYLGLLTFFGLIIAMVVQPFSGGLSDRWASAWGRRRPLIALGTLVDFVFLAILGWSGGLGWIALGYLGLQFSSNIAHGPAQGLLPDQVPDKQMGLASGIKNLIDMSGLVVSSLLLGNIFRAETRHPIGVLALIAGVLAAGALITLFGVKESDSRNAPPSTRYLPWWRTIISDARRHTEFFRLIASRLFYLIGIYGVQTFAQYYVRDVLAVENAVQLTGNLLAVITLTILVFVLAGGWLGDRIGNRRISFIASGIGCIGFLLLLLVRTPTQLLFFGSVLGVGIGLFLTSNWALANKLAPSGEEGKFLGLTNLATAGAAAIGRLEGPMIDILNALRPNAWWGYFSIFILGALCVLVSAYLLRRVPEERSLAVPALGGQGSSQ